MFTLFLLWSVPVSIHRNIVPQKYIIPPGHRRINVCNLYHFNPYLQLFLVNSFFVCIMCMLTNLFVQHFYVFFALYIFFQSGEPFQKYYKPAFHADEIGLTSDKYIPLNSSVHMLPLKVTYEPMSVQRWLLMKTMEQSLVSNKEMGFTDKDLDDIRRLISDTSLYLLGVTFLASVLHMLFEALAFQSDISFWQANKSLTGLSVRTLITDLISQFIIFLFLLDSETSVLVIIPSAFGILVQIWKVSYVCEQMK